MGYDFMESEYKRRLHEMEVRLREQMYIAPPRYVGMDWGDPVPLKDGKKQVQSKDFINSEEEKLLLLTTEGE